MVEYIFNKEKWDSEIRKHHNGENPFINTSKWVDICNGLKVSKVNSTMGIIDIGEEYEYIEVLLSHCDEV